MSYIGNSPENVLRNRRAIYEFVATAGQTAFSGVDSNGATLDLLQDNEQSVFLNGVRIIATDDYTVSGETLTLLQAASVGDILIVETQGEVANATTYTRSEADARYVNYNGDVISGNIQIAGDLTASSLAIDTDTLYVDATNNEVGIGTTSPSQKLEVSGGHIKITNAGNANLFINANNAGSDATIYFEEQDNVKAMIQHDASNDSMLFTDGALANTMTLKGTRVGIGTDTPATALHVDPGYVTLGTSTGTDNSWINNVEDGNLELVNEGRSTNDGAVRINRKNNPAGDTTYFRDTVIYDGKSSVIVFVDGSEGKVLIGASDYGDKLNVTGGGHFTENLTLSRQTNDPGSTGLILEKTRNTSVNGNTIVNAGDQLGYIAFRGNDGDQFLDGAYILAFADSSPANNDMPTNLQFWTTEDGNSSPTERMRIAQDGRVGIGLGGSNPSYMLHVDGGSNPAARFQQNSSTVQIGEFPANGGAVIWMDGSNGDLSGSDYFGIHALNATDLSFSADGGEIRMTMKNDGKLGIGTANPSEKLEVAGTALVENAKLKAIAKDISVTASDLFIYDTSKDSDGGAWRKRTQNTSWYNETLNTSIRGSRKEFPAVAVIVTRNTEVTIYDGDDPTLPMWMVFDGTGYSMLSNTHNGITRAAMKNGNLAVTSVSGYNHGGLAVINFISDYAYLKTAGYTKENTQGIANRGTQHQANDGTSNYIANNFVRSVAITVLPTAPIDSATGLPVPTIAIATDGGISVVKDNGDVFAITNTGSGYNYWDTVKFTKDYKLIIQANNQNISNQLTHIVDIPTSNVNANNVNARYAALNGRYYHGDSCSPRLSASSFKPKVAPLEKDMICMGHTQTLNGGLNFISEEPSTQSGQTSTSMMAYVDATKNTGWFVGDAKIVALASTDDTDISSSGNVNILAGKNWTNNASFPYETLTTSGLDISSAINTTAYGAANLTWVSTPGKTYTAYFNMTLNSGTMPRCFMQTSSSFGNGLEFTPENGANSFTFKATRSGSIYFSFSTNNGDASNYAVSGLELYEGGDANHYENPLVLNDHIGISVIGTVTKTAVETGADLMAYSGFNATNYLYQPYNSAINFGTGDCSYTWWGTAFSSGTDRVWFSHGKYNTASSGLNVLQYNSGGSGDEAHFYLGNGAAGYITVTGVEHGRWDCWTVTRKTGVLYVYRNGKLEGSVANTNNVNTSSLSHKGLYLGVGVSGSSVFPYGARELALFRISRTATTSEQAEKIYNDERHLFQENAKATLYGNAVIITSLAHDDDTGLLHAGTSAGRSVFQGLSRIDNTTDAVGAAISASNGLVVEE
jgi:hypothetical protein